MLDVILDTLKDFGIVLPFLFLSYLFMEWLESRAGAGSRHLIAGSGRCAPLFGGLLGAIPQCGFSAAAAGLYAGRVLSLGTLYAVFLSTSDEMLPILISERAAPLLILKILLVKVVCGIFLGFFTDLVLSFFRKNGGEPPAVGDGVHDVPRSPAVGDGIPDVPSSDNGSEEPTACTCGCADCSGKRGWKTILLSSLLHTAKIAAYLFVTVFLLNTVVFFVGEERLSDLLSSVPVLPQAAAALVGLIPNCAASVVVTELFLKGAISAGSMLAGLLSGAGIGTLILYRVNRPIRRNVAIVAVLWAMGFAVGLLFDLTGLSALIF